MAVIFESEIPDPDTLFIDDNDPKILEWNGRKALRLDGQGASLLVVPDLNLAQGCIEVDLGAEGTAYPGIAFRVLDRLNFELAYCQPHTSGKWDALQYDPVFHGSNTWQLYFGPSWQQSALVPANAWHHFKVEFQDQTAVCQVGNQPPLVIHQLAHNHQSGLVGLWTYLPAYFSNLRISEIETQDLSGKAQTDAEILPAGSVTEWLLEGFGVVDTEINGNLNLNRYLPVSATSVKLIQRIEMQEAGSLTFHVGFSDGLTLQVDDQIIFTGENLFHSSPEWEDRGYADPTHKISCDLDKGVHQITADLEAREFFGFGMFMRIEGEDFSFLPVDFFI